LLSAIAGTSYAQPHDVRIGVLAYRGEQRALDRWRPTADYLTQTIPGVSFTIEPLTLEGVAAALEEDRIDFLFTNPGNYVANADHFELAPIATVKTDLAGTRETGNRFGAVIFCRSSAKDIHAIGDLRGKSLAAVSPEAFGGFLVGAETLLRHGVDPYREIEPLRFLGLPQDRIVDAVLSGSADAGIVRTGVIEAMVAEKALDPDAIRVLNVQTVVGFDFLLSSDLFPEWVFAAARHAPSTLRNDVAMALLSMAADHQAARNGNYAGWTTPMNYGAVRRLFSTIEQARPHRETSGQIPFLMVWAFALPLGLFALVWWKLRPSPRQQSAMAESLLHKNEGAELSTYRLTPREQQVLDRILAGETNKEIALNLGISPKTVEFHRTHIMKKTKAGSVAQLVQIVLGSPENPQNSATT
jgi:DNA-binding CsgD family transcriptional regulator/ABC-type phosphate/phosphonate transport system substrate-binding protein